MVGQAVEDGARQALRSELPALLAGGQTEPQDDVRLARAAGSQSDDILTAVDELPPRRRLAKWRDAKIPVKEIALRLGRDASTLYRELKRNFFRVAELPELNDDHAVAAQEMAERRRAVHRKMVVHPALKLAVVDRLKAGWSPEQIAGRMRLERHPSACCTRPSIASPTPNPG